MSSFRKALTAIAALVALLAATPFLVAQPQDSELYGGWGGRQLNSRNIPAGSVVDPGTQLLYIVDTGLNLRQQARDVGNDDTLSELNTALYTTNPINTAGIAADLFDGPDGDPLPGAFAQSFITITNTHPTQAVTVHFRYFNDECKDILDFLLLLTCNDTLIFDPLNFELPGTTVNTGTRFYGPAVGFLKPIVGKAWASGRFLIFATASGASTNSGDNAELRFSYEERGIVSAGKNHHCANLHNDDYFGKADPLDAQNLIHPDNLHVFNANAVAFNYLIGSQIYAKLISEANEAPISQAYGLNAWTRPAVDLGADQQAEDNNYETGISAELGLQKLAGSPNSMRSGRRHPDGDGRPLAGDEDWRILTGGEIVAASVVGDPETVTPNTLYLRNDVHGGGSARRGNTNTNSFPHFNSWWGALGTPSVYGIDPTEQVINLLSIMDDYNGSGNGFGAIDDSYNIGPAETTYVLQIFDHAEKLYDFTITDSKPNISPPIVCQIDCEFAVLKITVDCLRVWIGVEQAPQASVEDLSMWDLQKLSLEGGGPWVHMSTNIPPIVANGDVAAGWIRFVRDNTQNGTWQAFNDDADWDADTPFPAIGTFVTIGFQSIVQGGLGAAWWLSAVASDPWVSSTGHQSCNGECPNGGHHLDSSSTPWDN